MATPILPLELWRMICLYISFRDLLRLSAVSQFFWSLSAPTIWCHLGVGMYGLLSGMTRIEFWNNGQGLPSLPETIAEQDYQRFRNIAFHVRSFSVQGPLQTRFRISYVPDVWLEFLENRMQGVPFFPQLQQYLSAGDRRNVLHDLVCGAHKWKTDARAVRLFQLFAGPTVTRLGVYYDQSEPIALDALASRMPCVSQLSIVYEARPHARLRPRWPATSAHQLLSWQSLSKLEICDTMLSADTARHIGRIPGLKRLVIRRQTARYVWDNLGIEAGDFPLLEALELHRVTTTAVGQLSRYPSLWERVTELIWESGHQHAGEPRLSESEMAQTTHSVLAAVVALAKSLKVFRLPATHKSVKLPLYPSRLARLLQLSSLQTVSFQTILFLSDRRNAFGQGGSTQLQVLSIPNLPVRFDTLPDIARCFPCLAVLEVQFQPVTRGEVDGPNFEHPPVGTGHSDKISIRSNFIHHQIVPECLESLVDMRYTLDRLARFVLSIWPRADLIHMLSPFYVGPKLPEEEPRLDQVVRWLQRAEETHTSSVKLD